MKTEKYLSKIGFYPGDRLFRKGFVKISIDGFNIYDHRKKVKESKDKSDLEFFIEFSNHGLVQVVRKRSHSFINIFDIDENIENVEPELSTLVIPTNKKMTWRSKDIFFLAREVKLISGFSAVYVYILDTDSIDPRFSISTC